MEKPRTLGTNNMASNKTSGPGRRGRGRGKSPANRCRMRVLLRILVFLILVTYIAFLIRVQGHHSLSISDDGSLQKGIPDPGTVAVSRKNNNDVEYPVVLQHQNKASLPRVLALVFPQYHREPLNDKFWGDGFTDWDNLRAAPEKNRLGFKIPRPTELGYYDLTDKSTRKRLGELALQHGLDGFVYHHYWFYDKSHPGPNLHAPLVEMLKDGYPDIPFCFNWAAVKWMSTWHGKTRDEFEMPEDNVMQLQAYPKNQSDPAITEHYNWLRQFFHHPNYIKVHGKPVLMMYQQKPGSFIVLKRFRQLAIQDGFPGLYITVGKNKPHSHLFPLEKNHTYTLESRGAPRYIFDKTVIYPNPSPWMQGNVLKVPDWCQKMREEVPHMRRVNEIIGIMTSFDNTPRRNFEEATLWSADDPAKVVERFRKSLSAAIYYETCCFPHDKEKDERKEKDDDRLILINSMNEWAEGMVMEPSDVFGRGFLEAIKEVKDMMVASGCRQYQIK